MTGILSAISKQFSKSLIMGAFFPVAIFVVAWLLFIAPLLPPGISLQAALQVFGTTWRLITITFVTIVITGLLHNFNTSIIRLYEGYPWRKTGLGEWRKKHHQKAFSVALARRNGMQMLLRAMGSNHPDYKLILKKWGEVNGDLRVNYPEKEDLVLPTRLGNAIRNFERYPSVQYRIEDIVFWPRLIDVIDEDYANAIDDATTSFNFVLNLSFLSYIMAGALAGVGLAYPPASTLRIFVPVLIFAGLGYFFYLMLIKATGAWGALVKGAFDLYRWDLLKKMGYQQQPTTRKRERDLWAKITQQTMFGDYRQWEETAVWKPSIDYVAPTPSAAPATAVISPKDTDFEITRAINPNGAARHVGIVIRIKNTADDPVDHLTVSDTLPEDLRYKWMSAEVAGCSVRVTGLNPYEFYIESPLPGQAELVLFYQAVEYP